MQKRNLIKPLAVAAVSIFLGAACCCCVSNDAASSCHAAGIKIDEPSSYDMVSPWQVVTDSCSNVFVLQDIGNMKNQTGNLIAAVTGRTSALSFRDWLVDGEQTYHFDYRFIWYDQDGKYVSVSPIQSCQVMPADPVRFSAVYPDEKCTSFSLILCRKNLPGTTAETPSSTLE